MDDLERALAASRAENDVLLEEERQLQEAIRVSRLDQADVSTASATESETTGENDDIVEPSADTNQMKRKASNNLVSKRQKSARPSIAAGSSSNAMKFPDGAIRITRTPGRQSAKNCVNLKDIIDKDTLVSACIYAFFIADEEVFPLLPFSHSSDDIYIGRDPNMDPVVPLACEKVGIAIKGKLTRKQLESLNPTLSQLNKVQHGYMRLVITSCNLMDIDTLEGDNHWYIHDLPKLSSPKIGPITGFEEILIAHLRALASPESFIGSIEGHYDYSKVKVDLVTSQPGTFSGAKAEQHGLLRLRRVVKDLGLDLPRKETGSKVQLEVCAASIGNLNTRWLNGFSDCALGKTDLTLAPVDSKAPKLKIFYPTVTDVKSAHKSAQQGASNIGCHTRPWTSASNDIKDLFYHYESKDAGRLFHQKLIMAYDAQNKDSLPYYIYIGSANMSQSAWGAIEPDKGKKASQSTNGMKLVKMSNFECGVVVAGHLITGLLEPGTGKWNDGIVPYNQNAARYDRKKDKPWNDPRWVEGYRDDWERE